MIIVNFAAGHTVRCLPSCYTLLVPVGIHEMVIQASQTQSYIDMCNGNTHDGFVSQTVLRLRGGGADNKRKQARKRKFANLQGDNSADLTGEGEPAVKKLRKQAPSSPADKKAKIPSETDLGNHVGVKDRDPGHSSQRFIVFIGEWTKLRCPFKVIIARRRLGFLFMIIFQEIYPTQQMTLP